MSRGPAISAVEQAEIATLLRALPLPEVRRRTGRSFRTLARIADVVEPRA